MKIKRFERIDSVNAFLKREEDKEIIVKRISIVPHNPDIFYVFYEDRENLLKMEEGSLRNKITDFRNFLVRGERTLSDIIRSVEQERTYWQNCDNPASKRALDYLSWLKDQLTMSAIAVNEMMRETKEILMRGY